MNIDKTNYVIFSNTNSNFDYHIHLNHKPLVPSNNVKFLGVYIDSNLTWQDHINHISNNVAKGVGILSKLKLSLPKSILRSIYCSLILPHISYCCTVWSACNQALLNKLVTLQKKAIRHISHTGIFDHTSPLFQSLKILKLPDLISVNIALFTYRCINCVNLPNFFCTLFTKNDKIHSYSTRQHDLIHPFPFRTKRSSKNLRNRAVNLWNSLPPNVTNCRTTKSFKKYIKSFFIDNYS